MFYLLPNLKCEIKIEGNFDPPIVTQLSYDLRLVLHGNLITLETFEGIDAVGVERWTTKIVQASDESVKLLMGVIAKLRQGIK